MRIRFLIFCLMLSLCMKMQAGFRFAHINSESGLPHLQVEGLAQDKKGNIWMGTRNGLSRYDGYGITTYYHRHGDSHSLSHNFIHQLFVDSKDRLWIGTETGVCRYRPETDDFKCYDQPYGLTWAITENSRGRVFVGGVNLCAYDEKADTFAQVPLLDNNFVNCLAADTQGNTYVATNKSIYVYDASLSNIHLVDPKYYSSFTEGFNVIIPIFIDSRSRLWIGRNGQGAMCVDLKTEETQIYPANVLSDGLVRTIREDARHRMFLGTENGLTVIHPDGSIEIARHESQNNNSLSDNSIFCILFDHAQNAWLSTYYGGVDVLMHNSDLFAWQEPRMDPGSLGARVARMMTETTPGVFWVATEDGGIQIYNANTRINTKFDGIPGMGENVYALYYDRDAGEMWIGTRYTGLFRYNMNTHRIQHYLRTHGLDSEGIAYILRKKNNGRLWVGTMAGLRYYDPDTDQFVSIKGLLEFAAFIHALMEDRDGNLWVGTTNYGLFCIDGKTSQISQYRKNDGSGLTDNYVVCLHQDQSGLIWIGTNNDGLHCLNPSTRKVQKVESQQSLSKASVCSIAEDSQHNLWISTTQGLFKFLYDKKSFVRFTTEDGLPVNQFNVSSSLVASNGRLLFGTVDGVIAFTPQQVTVSTGPFTVHLKRLILNDQEVRPGQPDSPLNQHIDETPRITLTHSQVTSFALEYGVIMPGNTGNIEYQIWLEGLDKTWRNVGTERKFSGNNLPPGEYTLHIRASNSNTGWDNCPEKTIVIKVLPPFWRSIWAYLLYLLALGGISLFVLHFIQTRIKAREDIRMAKMEKEKVEELDKAKFNFFTMVSHELKTPLSLIVAPLKSIADNDMDDDSRKAVDTALKNTRRMEELIAELVTFNKIETNNFTFYVQKGNPLEFITIACEMFCVSARGKGIKFDIECEDNGEEVWFSPTYVERIVSNLLSNALKFTDEGGSVGVKACITPSEDNQYSYLRIDISDTGIGIAEEEQGHIFDSYYQTKRGYNVNNSGWGIGLALVRRLVEKHQGRISLQSTLGVGSTFTVWLNVSEEVFPENSRVSDDKVIVPLDQYKFGDVPDLRPSGEDEVLSHGNEGGRLTLLIVDDNTDLLHFMTDYFSKKYHVLTATDGLEALSITKKKDVQMVISDVMMPNMDGYTLCRTLKQDMETSHIPVILLTAKGDPDDAVEGFQCGAEQYVTKPFDPKLLDMQVNNILQLIKSRQSEIAEASTENIEATSLSELDKKFVMRMSQLVDENIGNSDFAITDITRELGVSRTLLHIKMKSLLDMSMGDYIRKKRLDKACQMLRGGHNVSETAYATGFSDPNWFSKTFKKHMGITPTEYISRLKS